MKRKIKLLWKKALKGNSEAYRKLGILFLKNGKSELDLELAKLCLEKSMEIGNQECYFLYHQIFSKGKKVIDDRSYAEIYLDYKEEKNSVKRKELEKYLKLGTVLQRKMLSR